MTTKMLTASAALACLFLTGCAEGTASDDNAPGGPGMTYNGKPGVDIGGGFVLPYDGSGLSPGFGY